MPDESRKNTILEIAIEVFVRFGFRKTSMDEIARAADISRQGLYLHFPTKEVLFEAALSHFLKSSMAAVTDAVKSETLTLEQKLVAAFDVWVGRFVGMPISAADLAELTRTFKPMTDEYDERFADTVAKLVRSSGLAAAYKPASLTARQLADSIYATARGLKYSAKSQGEFSERMVLAVRALTAVMKVVS